MSDMKDQDFFSYDKEEQQIVDDSSTTQQVIDAVLQIHHASKNNDLYSIIHDKHIVQRIRSVIPSSTYQIASEGNIAIIISFVKRCMLDLELFLEKSQENNIFNKPSYYSEAFIHPDFVFLNKYFHRVSTIAHKLHPDSARIYAEYYIVHCYMDNPHNIGNVEYSILTNLLQHYHIESHHRQQLIDVLLGIAVNSLKQGDLASLTQALSNLLTKLETILSDIQKGTDFDTFKIMHNEIKHSHLQDVMPIITNEGAQKYKQLKIINNQYKHHKVDSTQKNLLLPNLIEIAAAKNVSLENAESLISYVLGIRNAHNHNKKSSCSQYTAKIFEKLITIDVIHANSSKYKTNLFQVLSKCIAGDSSSIEQQFKKDINRLQQHYNYLKSEIEAMRVMDHSLYYVPNTTLLSHQLILSYDQHSKNIIDTVKESQFSLAFLYKNLNFQDFNKIHNIMQVLDKANNNIVNLTHAVLVYNLDKHYLVEVLKYLKEPKRYVEAQDQSPSKIPFIETIYKKEIPQLFQDLVYNVNTASLREKDRHYHKYSGRIRENHNNFNQISQSLQLLFAHDNYTSNPLAMKQLLLHSIDLLDNNLYNFQHYNNVHSYINNILDAIKQNNFDCSSYLSLCYVTIQTHLAIWNDTITQDSTDVFNEKIKITKIFFKYNGISHGIYDHNEIPNAFMQMVNDFQNVNLILAKNKALGKITIQNYQADTGSLIKNLNKEYKKFHSSYHYNIHIAQNIRLASRIIETHDEMHAVVGEQPLSNIRQSHQQLVEYCLHNIKLLNAILETHSKEFVIHPQFSIFSIEVISYSLYLLDNIEMANAKLGATGYTDFLREKIVNILENEALNFNEASGKFDATQRKEAVLNQKDSIFQSIIQGSSELIKNVEDLKRKEPTDLADIWFNNTRYAIKQPYSFLKIDLPDTLEYSHQDDVKAIRDNIPQILPKFCSLYDYMLYEITNSVSSWTEVLIAIDGQKNEEDIENSKNTLSSYKRIIDQQKDCLDSLTEGLSISFDNMKKILDKQADKEGAEYDLTSVKGLIDFIAYNNNTNKLSNINLPPLSNEDLLYCKLNREYLNFIQEEEIGKFTTLCRTIMEDQQQYTKILVESVKLDRIYKADTQLLLQYTTTQVQNIKRYKEFMKDKIYPACIIRNSLKELTFYHNHTRWNKEATKKNNEQVELISANILKLRNEEIIDNTHYNIKQLSHLNKYKSCNFSIQSENDRARLNMMRLHHVAASIKTTRKIAQMHDLAECVRSRDNTVLAYQALYHSYDQYCDVVIGIHQNLHSALVNKKIEMLPSSTKDLIQVLSTMVMHMEQMQQTTFNIYKISAHHVSHIECDITKSIANKVKNIDTMSQYNQPYLYGKYINLASDILSQETNYYSQLDKLQYCDTIINIHESAIEALTNNHNEEGALYSIITSKLEHHAIHVAPLYDIRKCLHNVQAYHHNYNINTTYYKRMLSTYITHNLHNINNPNFDVKHKLRAAYTLVLQSNLFIALKQNQIFDTDRADVQYMCDTAISSIFSIYHIEKLTILYGVQAAQLGVNFMLYVHIADNVMNVVQDCSIVNKKSSALTSELFTIIYTNNQGAQRNSGKDYVTQYYEDLYKMMECYIEFVKNGDHSKEMMVEYLLIYAIHHGTLTMPISNKIPLSQLLFDKVITNITDNDIYAISSVSQRDAITTEMLYELYNIMRIVGNNDFLSFVEGHMIRPFNHVQSHWVLSYYSIMEKTIQCYMNFNQKQLDPISQKIKQIASQCSATTTQVNYNYLYESLYLPAITERMDHYDNIKLILKDHEEVEDEEEKKNEEEVKEGGGEYVGEGDGIRPKLPYGPVYAGGMKEMMQIGIRPLCNNKTCVSSPYLLNGKDNMILLVTSIMNNHRSNTVSKSLYPVNLYNRHWVAVAIDHSSMQMHWMDSMGDSSYLVIAEFIVQKLQYTGMSFQLTNIVVEQQKYNNCGWEVYRNMLSYVSNKTISQEGVIEEYSTQYEKHLIKVTMVEDGLTPLREGKFTQAVEDAGLISFSDALLYSNDVLLQTRATVSIFRALNKPSYSNIYNAVVLTGLSMGNEKVTGVLTLSSVSYKLYQGNYMDAVSEVSTLLSYRAILSLVSESYLSVYQGLSIGYNVYMLASDLDALESEIEGASRGHYAALCHDIFRGAGATVVQEYYDFNTVALLCEEWGEEQIQHDDNSDLTTSAFDNYDYNVNIDGL